MAGVGQWLEAHFGLEQAGLARIVVGALILFISIRPWAWPVKSWGQATIEAVRWVVSLRLRTPLHHPEKESGNRLYPPSVTLGDPLPPPRLAERESVERLREVFGSCKSAFHHASEYLVVGVGSRESLFYQYRIVHKLIQTFALPGYFRSLGGLDDLLQQQRATTEEELQVLVSDFTEVTRQYLDLLGWIQKIGSAFLDEAAFRKEHAYRGLYEKHVNAVRELRRVVGRQDIGRITTHLHEMEESLTPPTPDTEGSP